MTEARAAVLREVGRPMAIERITLTASGGPFRTWEKERLAKAQETAVALLRDQLKRGGSTLKVQEKAASPADIRAAVAAQKAEGK